MADFLSLCKLVDHQHNDWQAGAYPAALANIFPSDLVAEASAEIRQWPGYQPTPARALTGLSKALGLRQVIYKDESGRFGMGSFKALGGAYAVMKAVAEMLRDKGVSATPASVRSGAHRSVASTFTVATATDGNHGRSVAWGAQMAGVRCQIFIHREVSEGRAQAMAALGATVVRVDGDYDDSVRACRETSEQNGWQIISDTSWEGYTEPPGWVMAGYTVMVKELLDQLDERPTHIFLPAGVGGLAAAVTAAYWQALGAELPKIVIVESAYAACLIQSARAGAAAEVPIEQETVMAGLSCGEASPLAWEVLARAVSSFISIDDGAVAAGMRYLASGQATADAGGAQGVAIEAGECSLAGVIGLAAVCRDSALRHSHALGEDARVLLFGTEGATDPDIYQRLLSEGD